MGMGHFNLNRPVHLARRDAYFEVAVDVICRPVSDLDLESRIALAETTMFLLETSEKHAYFAVRSEDASQQENDFLHFLRLVSHNVQSFHSMMKHRAYLEAEESFLCSFLNTSPEDCALPAMHYQRRADDLFEGLWHALRQVFTPYRELQRQNIERMSEAEKDRYRIAYESIRQELATMISKDVPANTESTKD
ncbi:MAG: hypothetical protein KJ626_12290 [Verrucomicrobia bacterium]|nr:hypothetical protein [Verrucomicrobiota bacterium]